MINYIEGRLVEKTPTYAVIDCNGVGYFINISLITFTKIGNTDKSKLFVHTVIREDAHVLYGFAAEEERRVFRLLISVSGVGAATARLILSSLNTNEVQQAIVCGNVSALQRVKGIGEKSAQRIIVDLKGKIEKTGVVSEISSAVNNIIRDEALSALIMLGFVKNQAERVIDKILSTERKDITIEELIKLALKNL
ncbi:MAG: Holliday junction branch migration protein RuvA [Bacteroidales bacterium]|nr:Holliday junction branch migration protein RuvA [Bacteroidales bacterium]